MNIPFLKYSKIYFIISGTLTLASIIFLAIFGLNLGIDFTGGSILEVQYKGERPINQTIKKSLSELELGEMYLQPTGERGLILRMRALSEEDHQDVLQELKKGNELEERRFESIGPTIGRELQEKTKILIGLALVAILLYIAFAFRRLQKPIKSWQYGLVALIALFHDVFIPIGIFSVLGKFYGVQITVPIVAALLTVLGYSINDTVVVFDRIRENLLKRIGITFEETVERSLNQTLVRSINISFSTLLVLFSIFFFGGETLRYFALALIILGIAFGTYSSIFLASPMLVSWVKWRERKERG